MNFDFMEPPDRVRLVKSLRLLFLIGALDADGKLTPLGEQLVFVLVLGFPRLKSRKRDHWISAEVLIYQYFN